MFDPRWEKEYGAGVWLGAADVRLMSFCKNNCKDIPGTRVLDLGCGPGSNSFPLAGLGFTVDGIDGSESVIRFCVEHKIDAGPTFTVGDVTHLPYRDDCFHLVIDIQTFVSLPDEPARQALAEAIRVLRPGGIFFSLTAADDFEPPSWYKLHTRRMTEDQAHEFMSPFEMHKVFRTALVYPDDHVVAGLPKRVSQLCLLGRKHGGSQ